ncbi:MAG TPA: hypothetical protein VM925_20290 [Labilithrix sp.]|nr:hypothetical protein [Labilithrix sp.]
MLPTDPTANEKNIHDDAIFYRLFDEAERVRWKMTDYDWSSIEKDHVSPAWRAVAREVLVAELTTFSATERFFADFGDDVDFTQWLTVWLYEETKHPSVFLRWLDVFGEKFDSRFMLQGRVTIPFMPSKMGTLATNIISEMVAAALYTTVGAQPGIEPVLASICNHVGGDEARHAASFYSYAKKRLARSEKPNEEKSAMLRVLDFWMTPELNRRVGHPVNLLANSCKANPLVQEAVPFDAIHAGVENAYKRACRVFETLLGLELRSVKDVRLQLAALDC